MLEIKKLFSKPLLTALALVFSLTGHAQNNFEPTILILTPNKTTADKTLNKEIKKLDKEIKRRQNDLIQERQKALERRKGRPKNLEIMYEKKVEFAEDMDYYSQIASGAEDYLQYRFYERFNNLLIYAINERSNGNTQELSDLAEKHKMQYVLNFPKIHSFQENGTKKSIVTVQLYDNLQQKLLLEQDFTGDDQNPGFDFACSEGSVQCTMNNALSQAFREVIYIVAANNPTLIKERKLLEAREAVLFDAYYSKEPNQQIVTIISENDTSIATEGFYQGFMD
ncbi:MAG: hypothetical protein ACFHU9_02085 [Fluviicola sp.]